MSKKQNRRLAGGGPWLFELPALSSGEVWVADFENREYNGTKSYFRKWLPFDYAQVTNQNPNYPLKVTYNGIYDDLVVPGAVEVNDQQSISGIRIENVGGGAISAGDVSIAVGVEPYGADDRAREQKSQPVVAGIVEKFTGVSLNGVF